MRHVPQAIAHHQGGAGPAAGRAGAPSRTRSARTAPVPLPLRPLSGAAPDAHAGAAVIEEVSPPLPEAAEFQTPDLIEPVVAFRSWRLVDGDLRSVYLPFFWTSREVSATCMHADSPDADAPRTAPPGHAAPDRGCTCGVYAYYRPDLNFPTVDYRGVSGIVSLWGTIELHAEGMRAQHARIEALALYSRWTTGQLDAVREVAADLGVDLVDLDDMEQAAPRYGRHITRELVPGSSAAENARR